MTDQPDGFVKVDSYLQGLINGQQEFDGSSSEVHLYFNHLVRESSVPQIYEARITKYESGLKEQQ